MSDALGKVNILLVDDRADKLLAIEAVLEDLGQNIVRAYSGREALRHVLTHEFAVILLDVNMPGMDGFETAELIRQRKSSEHTPIIFITSFGDERHIARGYSLGAVDFIQAPVIAEVLRSKVAVFVDLYRKTEQVSRQAEALRRRATQLQKLAAASLAINGARSIERMLQIVTDTAREIIGSHQAITLFVDPRPGKVREATQAFGSYSDKYADWRTKPLRLDAIAETVVFRSHTATRMTEAELLEHPDWEIVRHVRVPPVTGGMLAAPLVGRDGTRLGVVYLSDRIDGAFSSGDELLVVQLAQVASIAVENALFAEEREANRLKDEFLSTLSHELRTPLNAILGWTQLMQMQELEPEVGHALEVIERNARAQTKLIEDLLDVSRITTGKLRVNPRPTTLAPIVRAAAEAVQPTADTKGVALELVEPAENVRLVGDPDRLQQVVWNLLANAVKFTPAGGKVRLEAGQDGSQILIRVIDTGLGMAPAFLPYVFDRFRQADSTSTRSHGGLGIGLTIVRHIVELHGGTVRADSAGEGLGSSFTVTLPIPAAAQLAGPQTSANGNAGDHGPADAPARADAADATPSAGNRELSGLRVLVVDDEPDAREVLRHILRRAGATVETAADAREALTELARIRPDVLVSDIAMPGADGYSLIQAVRQLHHENGGATPAIAVTAYARDEDRLHALSVGFQAHQPKPIEPGELVKAVRSCSTREPRGSREPSAVEPLPPERDADVPAKATARAR